MGKLVYKGKMAVLWNNSHPLCPLLCIEAPFYPLTTALVNYAFIGRSSIESCRVKEIQTQQESFHFFFMHYGWWANLYTKDKWQFFEIILILSAIFFALKPHLSIDDRPSQLRLHWKIFYWVVQSKRNTNTAGIFLFFFFHFMSEELCISFHFILILGPGIHNWIPFIWNSKMGVKLRPYLDISIGG